ncbi:hypothetical protein B0H17DRAFT_1090110 [Mycena rosella]|uniref:Uncharacterized protein n=1 Tax=Mycena rosella TaxID=1033263 RepID=A0AAD7CVM5_MYCRO|nr:hypothetical protein B0H17DRAFT_1090110 [Mycena rosella]
MASSSSSSSPSSSTSEYLREPVSLVYPSASTSFRPPEKPCRPFRIVMQPTMQQQQKRKRSLMDGTGSEQRSYPAGEMNQYPGVREPAVREPLVISSPVSSFGPSGKLKAKPPKPYISSEDLLAALQTSCIEDPEVDFSGSYLLTGPDADTLSDKQRVQAVAHDIWKATGYRFTVKDHPPSERGHKTRLWCSQDEARRSKHRGTGDVPRVSKQGEVFAKQRYPCRSRLMISCIPEEAPRGARAVTVRMHHYMRHDSYLEGEAAGPVPVAPSPVAPMSHFFSVIKKPLPAHLVGRVDGPPPPALREQEGEWELRPQTEPDPSPSPSPHIAPALSPRFSPHFAPAPPPIDPQLEQHRHPHPHHQPHAHPPPTQPPLSSAPSQLPAPHPPQHTPPHAPQLPPAADLDFERRMRTHIARIRDFCDGLEYQVQFHDQHMLAALERDAAPFFALLDNCLRAEGRHDNPAR